MEYRNLGKSGLQVSAVGVGCNNFGRRLDQEAAGKVVAAALELGVTLFDTADIYGTGLSETYLGAALKGSRERAVVATKFGSEMGDPTKRGTSRRYVVQAIDASLRRLNMDYIDLYQVHFPDPKTPLEETMSALDDLVHQGKVRYIGHSNFAGWQAAACHYIAREECLTPFISAQNHYNFLDRSIERELVPACEAFGLSVVPYFPLASGLLTGKYRKGKPLPEGTRITANPRAHDLNERNWNIVEKLAELGERSGHSMTELAFGWFVSHRYIGSVIAGAMTPDQVRQNVAAAQAKLPADVLNEIDSITS